MNPQTLRCSYSGCGGELFIEEEGTEWDRTLYIECMNTACRAEWRYNGDVRKTSRLSEPCPEEVE